MAGTHMVAVGYDSAERAEAALGSVRDLSDEHALVIHDAAIVLKQADGRVELQQSRELALGEGVVSGGSIGLLLGLALAVPVAGAIVGFAGGAGFAALDKGIPNEHMRKLGATIARGHAILFALVSDVDWPKLNERIAPFGGDLVTSEVDDDVLALLATSPTTLP